ncbi:MAG: thiolase family protein [Actinomycetota bacterium]|nr:thiolase family protein [Actinomycetota bacterium]
MHEAVIIDAVRTPLGKRNGSLSDWHPGDLAAEPLKALAERNSLDPSVVDDVIMGCVSQVGEQTYNIGRNAVLGAGWPETVPGVTIDRQCGSSQQSVHFAAQGVMAGAYDVVVAAGIESMTRVPMGSSMGGAQPFGEKLRERYQDSLIPQGLSAELIAEKWGITREELDSIGFDSQARALKATEEGRFENEIIPIEIKADGVVTQFTRDEGIRPGTTIEKLASLRPAFKEDGVVTAGNSSQITDGSAALLITSAAKAKELGLTPRARFVSFSLAGTDPITMLTGPIPATEKVLAKAGLTHADIDLYEINEAFAAVIAAWLRETGADWDTVNVNGGAIALGHPLGASGARLMTTLVNELERSGGRYGLQSMCEGGGLANGTIIESLA